ncbi:MAG: hydrolase [Candidatus Metalachnospira sp.]|nr:hydrolase [Candidatus Metalachnospira sp.]
MIKITGSKFNMYDSDSDKAVAYMDCVAGVIDSKEVGMLSDYVHHHFTTRLQHSMNVSYYSFMFCRFLGWDYRSAARAGLMHDLYFFDNKSVDNEGNKLLKHHPFDALDNSEKTFDLNEIEKDAIVNHMWPCQSISRPRYKESVVVSFSDKLCAVMEATSGSGHLVCGTTGNAVNKTTSKITSAYRFAFSKAVGMCRLALDYIN